jgi:hypothetical protein
MPLVAFILNLLLMTGLIGPAIIVVGYLAWFFGMRDPFLLTITAVGIGGVAGWALSMALEKMMSSGKRGGPSTPAPPPPPSQINP